MATLQSLRREAKALGISAAELRGASSAAELRALIAEVNGTKPRKAARKAVRKARPGRKPGRPRKVSTTRATGTRGRPAKKAPAAKSATGKAKRPSISNGKSGRNLLGAIDFNDTDGWTPRAGSAPDRIVRAVKKARGNRAKAFEALRADVWDFVGRVKRNGDKRTKAEAEAMLRYRISRTLFDFANATGQHKISTNRIPYGTGPNATGRKVKAKPGRKATRKPAAKATTGRKRGRPKGSKNKPK